MSRQESVYEGLLTYVKNTYHNEPVHPWVKYPKIMVLQHDDSKKIYGFFDHEAGTGKVNAITLKPSDPLLIDFLIQEEGFSRSQSIGRGRWLTVDLDGTVPLETVCRLVDGSFLTTATPKTRQKYRPPKEWVVPSNLKYFDSTTMFEETDVSVWKQGRGIKKDDIVFLYAGQPVSAILYKCIVEETDIPYNRHFEGTPIMTLMTIRLLRRYPRDRFTFDRLKGDYGVGAIRGPRGIPDRLSEDLNREE